MSIKHMPSGLFPHFDSGFERRPYLVRAGETAVFGCRLDHSEAAGVSLILSDSACERTVEGQCTSTNDRGQRYFSFTVDTSNFAGRISYRFVTSDGEESKVYAFELLTQTVLKPVSLDAGGTCCRARYEAGNNAYELCIDAAGHGFTFSFSLNLNVKTNLEQNENARGSCAWVASSNGSVSMLRGSDILLEILPEIRLLRDVQGRAYELSFDMVMVGSGFYGFGEKFDRVNQKGLRPLNFVVEQYSHQEDKTYFPIPFFFSDAGVGFLQTNTFRSCFDLSAAASNGRQKITVTARCPQSGELFSSRIMTGSPAEIIRDYARVTGAPALPPAWTFGPWMSSNGWNTQAEALEQVERMNSLAIPATVMVLEAWSDEETFYIWNGAQYAPRADGSPFAYADFTFPADGKWPDPKAFAHALAENGLKLILWQIPVVKHEAAEHGAQLDLDTEYAIQNGLCIKNEDGSPYRVTEMWFGNSLMPDFTNPQTCHWWFDKRHYLVEELGVAGFKTDGGEFLFDASARLSDGRSIEEAHNDFPNLYEGAYHAFLQEAMGPGNGVTFSRAGYAGSQKYPLHWAGDQVSEFGEFKGQLTAGLSLGLSGVPFWGFDIGGFAGDFPSAELYLRSAALAAFSPVMQFHSEPRYGQYYMTAREHWNNDRSPWNMAEANRDERIADVYRLFANLRMNLMPYILREAESCSQTSRPMMAHLIYDFLTTDRDAILNIEDEYMFGRDLLVAPIIEEGCDSREIYLPKGSWFDLWTGEAHEGGGFLPYPCPLGRIPVFVRSGAMIPCNLNERLVMGETSPDAAISNRLDRYENLCFLSYGENAQISFRDAHGNAFAIRRTDDGFEPEGTRHDDATVLPMTGEPMQAVGRQNSEPVAAFVFGRNVAGTKFKANVRREDAR